MLTIREVIRTFYNALIHRFKKFRSNWDQNDPTADDFIKNRPFYVDDSKSIVVMEETSFFADSYGEAELPLHFFPEESAAYKVTYDGEEWILQCLFFQYYATIGDANSPFYFEWGAYRTGVYIYDSPGKHTIKVEKVDVKKIPSGLMPELSSVAYSGNYDDLQNKPEINECVVRYDSQQNLSTAQQNTARINIDAARTTHTHSANDISSGVLGMSYGGTGYSSLSDTTYTTPRYRGSALVRTESTPTLSGVINWQYE